MSPLENHSPLEVVRGVAPMLGVGAIGVALGMLLVSLQLDCLIGAEAIMQAQSRCNVVMWVERWGMRLIVLGGVSIMFGMVAESKLED